MIVSTPTRVWSFKRLPLIKKYCESDMLIFFYFFWFFRFEFFHPLTKLIRFVWVCACVNFAILHKYLVYVFQIYFDIYINIMFCAFSEFCCWVFYLCVWLIFLWWFYVLFDWFFVIKLFTFIFLTFLQLLPVSLPWFDWLFVNVFSFLLFSQIVYLFYSTDWFLFCYSFS